MEDGSSGCDDSPSSATGEKSSIEQLGAFLFVMSNFFPGLVLGVVYNHVRALEDGYSKKEKDEGASDEEEDGTDIDNPEKTPSKEEKRKRDTSEESDRIFEEAINNEFDSTGSSLPDDSGLETATDFNSSYTGSVETIRNGEEEIDGYNKSEWKRETGIGNSESESDFDDFTDAMESVDLTAARDTNHDELQKHCAFEEGENDDNSDDEYQAQAREGVDLAIDDALTILDMGCLPQESGERNGYHDKDDSTIESKIAVPHLACGHANETLNETVIDEDDVSSSQPVSAVEEINAEEAPVPPLVHTDRHVLNDSESKATYGDDTQPKDHTDGDYDIEMNDIKVENQITTAGDDTTTSIEYVVFETLNVPNAPVVKNAIDDDIVVEDGSDNTTSSDADTVKDAGVDVRSRENELSDKIHQFDENTVEVKLPNTDVDVREDEYDTDHVREQDDDTDHGILVGISHEVKSESHAGDDITEPVKASDVESSNTRKLLTSLAGEEIPHNVIDDNNSHDVGIDEYIIDRGDEGGNSDSEVSGDVQREAVSEEIIAPHVAKAVECSNVNVFCTRPIYSSTVEIGMSISTTHQDDEKNFNCDIEGHEQIPSETVQVSNVNKPSADVRHLLYSWTGEEVSCHHDVDGGNNQCEYEMEAHVSIHDYMIETDDAEGEGEVQDADDAKWEVVEEDTISPYIAKSVERSNIDVFCSQRAMVRDDEHEVELNVDKPSEQLSDEQPRDERVEAAQMTVPSTDIRNLFSSLGGDNSFVEYGQDETNGSECGNLRIEDYILDVKVSSSDDVNDEDDTLPESTTIYEDDISPFIVAVKNQADVDYFNNVTAENAAVKNQHVIINAPLVCPDVGERIDDESAIDDGDNANEKENGDRGITIPPTGKRESVLLNDELTTFQTVEDNREDGAAANADSVIDEVIVPFAIATEEAGLNISDIFSTIPESPKTENKVINYFEDDVVSSDVRKEVKGQYNIGKLLMSLDGELAGDIDLDDSTVSETSPPKKRVITDEMVREAIRFLMMKPFSHSYGMYNSWDSLLDDYETSVPTSARTFALVSTPRNQQKRRENASTVFALIASPSMQRCGDAMIYHSDIEEPYSQNLHNIEESCVNLNDMFAALEGKPNRTDYAYDDPPNQVIEEYQYVENRPVQEAMPGRLVPDRITYSDDDSSSASSSDTSGTYILDNDVIKEEEQALLRSVPEAEVDRSHDESEYAKGYDNEPEKNQDRPKAGRVFFITSAMLAANAEFSYNEQPTYDQTENYERQSSSSTSSSSESYLEEIPPGYGPHGRPVPKDVGANGYQSLHEDAQVKLHYNEVMTARYDDDDPLRFRPISRDDSLLDPSPRQSPRGSLEHSLHLQNERRNRDNEYSPELLEIERQRKKSPSASSSSSEPRHKTKDGKRQQKVKGNDDRLETGIPVTEPAVTLNTAVSDEVAPSRVKAVLEHEDPVNATYTTTVSHIPQMRDTFLTQDVPNLATNYSRENNEPIGAEGFAGHERDIQSEESILSQSDYQGYSGYSSDDGEYDYEDDNESFMSGARVFALVGAPSDSTSSAIRVIGSIEVYRAEGEMDNPKSLYSYEISKGTAGPDGRIKKLQEQSFTYENKSDIVVGAKVHSSDELDGNDNAVHNAPVPEDEAYFKLELPYDMTGEEVSEREGLQRQVESLSDLLSEKTMELQRLKDDYPWLDRLMSYPNEHIGNRDEGQAELIALYRQMEEAVLELMNIYKETRSQLKQLSEIESG